MSIHLFGIRHHGPGCARSLLQALHALQPDCILVEGPPEADTLMPFVGQAGLQPPVALLVYAPQTPQQAVFYPFAEYSPEWQAIRYANEHAVPVRFCDLPQSHRLATPGNEPDDGGEPETVAGDSPRTDPLRWFAHAAGYGDTETWWDHLVEQRSDSLELFAAIAEMMTAARREAGPSADKWETLREAYMRTAIRQAEKQGYQRIAVVCGAWHVPALASLPSAKSDTELLKGLPKVKLAATWTPWSYGRLASRSGYRAGVAAPGWYHHLWHWPRQASLYWLTEVAALLRRHDLDASSAHIIEAVRLADTLAAMRERPRPGLDELQEAVRAVFCHDTDAPLRLIQQALLINDRLGEVPAEVPTLPLPQDVQAQQKRLRLTPQADFSSLTLDLREAAHLQKSVLLHRLALLGIDWGRSETVRGKSGTFHEQWRLAWRPEFALRLIEANVWGGTLEGAAIACATDAAAKAETLPELTTLVDKLLLADLGEAVGAVMQKIQMVAALTPDLGFMLDALPPLVNAMRYGSVRGTDTAALGNVVDGMIARICIALPFGTRALADDAASTLSRQLNAADQAVRLQQREEHSADWFAALEKCALSDATHALLGGRCTRMLTEQSHWTTEQAARQLALHCSHAVAPLAAAHWLEGFLQGSGALLVHNDELWQLIDGWLASLNADAFTELLPLLRRTFGTFSLPERRQLAERAAAGSTAPLRTQSHAIDEARAVRLLPVLHTIFGARAPAIEQE
jgi:hypothetical protein